MRKAYLRLSSSLYLTAIVLAPAAQAQEEQKSPIKADKSSSQSQDTVKSDAQAHKHDEIIVVGSRIRRGTNDVSQQVKVIKPEDAARTGRSTIREVLQSNMITGGGDQNISTLNMVLVNGGPGVANLSLRRQGPGRTLIMLNGRRLAPAGVGGSVSVADLNTVPTSLIQETQILKDGASSIYGSDAIAGVVDIITRKRVRNFEISSVINMADESGGETYRVSTVGGYATDRFNLSFGVDYNVSRELEFSDRKRYRCPTSYLIDIESKNPVPGSADSIDPATGKPRCWPRDSGGTTQNMLTTGLLPDSEGNLYNTWILNPAIKGGIDGMEGILTSLEIPGGEEINFKNWDKIPYYNKDMLSTSVTGQSESVVGMVSMSYDVQALGDAELYMDILGSDRRYFYDFYQPEEKIYYVDGSPLIPEEWSGLSSGLEGGSIVKDKEVAAIASLFSGMRRDKTRVRFWRILTGLRGDLPFPGWRYDISHTWSRSNAWQKTPVRLTSNLRESMDVIKLNGKFVCADEKARSQGCVPIPEFSPKIFQKDGLPKAWLDYVSHLMTTKTLYTDNNINLDFDGPLFDLPYGQAKGAIGSEINFNAINDQPDAQSITNNVYNYSSSVITKGKGHSFAAYGEIELPILAEVALVKSLSANASTRITKGDGYGTNFSYKIGTLYTPFSWISLRTSYGTSYRAPSLFERYQGDTSGYINSGGIDPCSDWDTKLTPGTPTYNNCKSENLPAGFKAFDDILAFSRGGKSTGLKGERSRNFSMGLALQPELPAGWGNVKFSAEYYNLKIRGGITPLPATSALALCYDEIKFRKGGLWCPLIGKRDPQTYQLTSIISTYLNMSSSQTEGLDFELNYARNVGIGTMGINANLSYVMTNKSRLFDTEPYDDTTGALKEPRATANINGFYQYKRWSFGYTLDWVDNTDNLPFYKKLEEYGDEDFRRVIMSKVSATPNYFMHSASISYNHETWMATFAVRNITNAMAPRISAGVDDRLGDMLYYSGYDLFGRAYTLTLHKTF